MLSVVRCALLAVCRSLSVVNGSLFMFVVCGKLSVVCCLTWVVCCLLCVACCLLVVVCCFVVSLCVVRCLMLVDG